MNNIDKKIQDIVQKELRTPESYDNMINQTLEKLETKKNNGFAFKFAAACCSLVLITGVVFAKDIEKIFIEKFLPLGKGVSTAVENGYVAKSEMKLIEKDMVLTNKQTGDIIDTIHTKVKIEDAVIANGRIGIEVYLEFDSKLNNYVNLGKNTIDGNIDYENSHHFNFNDIFILDEENNILALAPEGMEKCQNYFTNNNLLYISSEENINEVNSIINNIDNSDSNLIKTNVEIYFRYDETIKPKKLYLFLGEFNLIPKVENNGDIEGNMKFDDNIIMDIDIPEKFYDTTEEHYKVTKCENENFNVYTAKVTNTGFEIGIVIENEEEPIYPIEIDEIANNKEPYHGDNTREGYIEYYGEEYVNLFEAYYRQLYLIRPDGIVVWVPWIEPTEGCYVINSNGDKFPIDYKNHNRTEPPIKDKYRFNVCFSMTRFDATDEVTVIIDYDGKPVHIELEKIDE